MQAVTSTGKRRNVTFADQVAQVKVMVTSYALLRLDFAEYQRVNWSAVLLDEAQPVKNHPAKTYQVCSETVG